MDKKEEDKPIVENTSILSGGLELRRKLHLFVSTQQSQRYTLISHFKLQLTGIYLNSKVIKDALSKITLRIVGLSIFKKQKKTLKEKQQFILSGYFIS
jgi:hypothetical protein